MLDKNVCLVFWLWVDCGHMEDVLILKSHLDVDTCTVCPNNVLHIVQVQSAGKVFEAHNHGEVEQLPIRILLSGCSRSIYVNQ